MVLTVLIILYSLLWNERSISFKTLEFKRPLIVQIGGVIDLESII